MSVTSIHHINITAPQALIDEVKVFYETILGLSEGYRPDFGVPGYWLYKDQHPMVHLLVLDRPGGHTGHFDHIAFQCSDIKTMISTLESKQIAFSTFEMEASNQAQLFVEDPAGIKVELNFPGETLS